MRNRIIFAIFWLVNVLTLVAVLFSNSSKQTISNKNRVLFWSGSNSSNLCPEITDHLYSINSDGSDAKPLLRDKEWEEIFDLGDVAEIRASPNGKYLALLRHEEDFAIYLLSIENKHLFKLMKGFYIYPGNGWTWSPDNSKVAFIGGKYAFTETGELNLEDPIKQWGLYVIEVETGEIVYFVPDFFQEVSWSPNGEYIAITNWNRETGETTIGILNAVDGSNQQHLVLGEHPSWSPDSKKIIFGTTHGIYTINTDGNDLKAIIYDDAPQYYYPSLSPDGKYIAFKGNSQQRNRYYFYIIKADGNDEKVIEYENRSIFSKYFIWSADGKQIVFAGNWGEVVRDSFLSSTEGQNYKRCKNSSISSPQNIYVTDVETGRTSLLTHGVLSLRFNYTPTWLP